MNLDLVIAHLKTHAPVFEGRVAGAAEYAQAVADQVWLKRPAAYVIPLQDEPEPERNLTGFYQIVREKIGVIVDLDNSADRRGQAAACAVDDMRTALFRALLNWRPDLDRQSRGFSYDGGGIVPDGLTRAYLRWQFDFVIATTISTAEVWQPPSVPLTGIEGQLTGTQTLLFQTPLSSN